MAPLLPFRGPRKAQQHYTQTLPQLQKEAALVAQEAAEKLRASVVGVWKSWSWWFMVQSGAPKIAKLV